MAGSASAQTDVIRPEVVTQDDGTTTVLQPPLEQGNMLKPDLVELDKFDPRVILDVRYATTNNFAKEQVYPEPRAFLQRPAAEAMKRAHDKLREQGYGLIVYDAYRPWSVTKKFWDITPQDKKEFVADPAIGSRHNRGCAVDVSLYDIKTSKPVEMPTDYDEFTERAYPTYSGGSEASRKHRDILRAAMESEGFKVYPAEWWHFDFKGFERYPIMDIGFDEVGAERRK